MRVGSTVVRAAYAVAVLAGLGCVAAAEPRQTQTLTLTPGEALPTLWPGAVLVLEPGRYFGPWEIAVPDVTLRGNGATLTGASEGSSLVLSAAGIRVEGLTIDGSGPIDDLYTPDAALWLVGCDGCKLTDVSVVNATSAVRSEGSADVTISGASFVGAPASPALTLFDSPRFTLSATSVVGFLDGIYLERSDSVSVVRNRFEQAARYALHVMFSNDVVLEGNTVRGGNVGSAAMYGRGLRARGNVFAGHTGPLAFGLLIQELADAEVSGNAFIGNTVGVLVVSAPDVTISDNLLADNGFAMLVQRTRTGGTSAVRLQANSFEGNVSDVALDDPEAAVSVVGNHFEGASRLDLDHDGVSDVPHLPSSSYDMFASRQPDLSLFALNPGILLWQTAEVTVPALRLATLTDAAPALRPSVGAAAAGVVAGKDAAGPATGAPVGREPTGIGTSTVMALGLVAACVFLGAFLGRPVGESS